jgi:hypothetical protein
MKAKNRGYFRSGVGEVKFRQPIGFFTTGLTATDAAEFTQIALRSANTIFIKLRKKNRCAMHRNISSESHR